MKWVAPDHEVDQRILGQVLCKKIARRVNSTGRMPWIAIDGGSR